MPNQFIRLPENQSAFEAIQRLASFSLETPFLFVHGPTGTGKTHLVDVALSALTLGKTGRSVAAAELSRSLLQPSIERQPLVAELAECDFLAIEDLQHLMPAAAEVLALILDRRTARRRPVIVTATIGPAELKFASRLISRLAGGLVVGIQVLSRGSRRLLAQELARQRGMKLAQEIFDWLAETPGGARPILGQLTRLETLGHKYPSPLTMNIIRNAFQANDEQSVPTLERIAGLIGRKYGVDVKILRGPARLKNVVWPRQIAMFLARQRGIPLVEVGRFFGGRDHSTVLHSCAKVEQVLTQDEQLFKEIQEVLASLPG